MKITRFSLKTAIFICCSSILISCATAKQDKPYTAYLFSYFIGNGEGEEAIHYAISPDGYNYYALNNNQPVVRTADISRTGRVRDPHILRKQNGEAFYMVVTDLLSKNGWTNTAMILLRSNDLINWTSTVIDIPQTFSEFSEVRRVWAPQTIYDEEEDKYMVYFSMQEPGDYDKIYYAYVNDDFTALEAAPRQLFFNPNKTAAIDGDIVKKDGKFYLFYKTEGENDKGIKVAVSNKLTSGYIAQQGNVDQTEKAVEGSGVFKLIDSNKYILMYDVYMDGKYQFTESKDLNNFEVVDQQISMNFHPRHGSVIPITEEEKERLLKEYPSDNLPAIIGSGAEEVKTNNIVINQEKSTVYLPVRSGTDLSAFNPLLQLLFGEVAIAPGGPQNFKNGSVEYVVNTASSGEKTYKVTVEIANNPVLEGYYADPEIIFSRKTGKFYLYPTSDGFTGWSGTYFKTFSSEDLVDWKDEGKILDLKTNVSWADRNAWAPCIAEKKVNGEYKYFYYFTAAQKIGVAVANHPAGPFNDIEKPLIDEKPQGITAGQVIDPEVFTDPKSGKSYLYWGNGFMAVAELNDDMISLKEGTTKVITPDRTFREGAEVFYRNGIYYFLWSENDTRSPDYRVRYATSTTPVGPLSITENNLVIAKSTEGEIYGTGHNSVLQVPNTDQWYSLSQVYPPPGNCYG